MSGAIGKKALAERMLNAEMDRYLAQGAEDEGRSLEQWLKLLVSDQRLISSDFVGAAMASRSSETLRAAQLRMPRDILPDGTQGFDLRPHGHG